MSEDGMFVIKVPASSANLGPGFDSIGLAVNLYLTITAEKSDKWEVIPLSKEMEEFPTDETNFICMIAINTAKDFGKEMPPCKLKVKSEIPLARGLGSSASAIVAGIELADCICELHLTKDDKLKLAAKIEGHPDNVGASVFGGLFIGYQNETETCKSVFLDLNFDLVAVVPKEILLTKASRDVLPKTLPFSEAVKAGAVANLLIASLLSGNWEQAGKMMQSDLYHQPYRRKLVPHFAQVEEIALGKGAFGVTISGAGPTVLCFAEIGKGDALASLLEQHFPDMDVLKLQIDRVGSIATHSQYEPSL